MAADTRANDGISYVNVRKIHRVGDWIIGSCGMGGHADHLAKILRRFQDEDVNPLEALQALAEMEKDKKIVETEDVGMILLSEDGIFMYDGLGVPYQVQEKFVADGSGSYAAMGAYHMACRLKKEVSPGDCVRVAMKTDINTGGRVHTLRLKSAPKKRKKNGHNT
jgi:20S proteasome alpha/beta subunit